MAGLVCVSFWRGRTFYQHIGRTMSTATPPSASAGRREILIVSHSTLFYWWPVWAMALLMWLITVISGDHMATVPHNSEVFDQTNPKKKASVIAVTLEDGKTENFPNRN